MIYLENELKHQGTDIGQFPHSSQYIDLTFDVSSEASNTDKMEQDSNLDLLLGTQ